MLGSVRCVAIVGDGGSSGVADATRDLEEVVEANGGRSTAVDDADAIVAVGERALTDSIGDDRSTPMLPIGSGRFAAPRPAAADAVRQLLSGEARVQDHPLLTVAIGEETVGRALYDVTLTTAEPARISEYGVSFPGGRASTFRGDAVVVATPLGSGGYAGAAGGPLLEPGTGLSVVPVAPFTIRKKTWVAPGRVTLSVERDGEPVTLVLDGSPSGAVPPDEPVFVAEAGRVELLSVPAATADE